MEVPGKKLDPVQICASPTDFKYWCQECLDRYVSAKKFCQQCQEYFCSNCCEFHKKVKTARKHVLVDILKVDHAKSQSLSPTITCSEDTDKVIDFFCPSHNTTVCSVCAFRNHKPCQMKYIPDISE